MVLGRGSIRPSAAKEVRLSADSLEAEEEAAEVVAVPDLARFAELLREPDDELALLDVGGSSV